MKNLLGNIIKKIHVGHILLFVSGAYANQATVYYFTEKDGENRTIFYKAFCFQDKLHAGMCSLKALSVGNSKASSKCAVQVDSLYEWDEAKKEGDAWIISSSAGICDYTNTYHISETGMLQIKSAPMKKKNESLCEVFEPKTYRMTYHPDVSDIRLNVKGCDNLNILRLE